MKNNINNSKNKVFDIITENTVKNYQSRITSFDNWANSYESTNPAEIAREKLTTHINKKFNNDIRILDVGCGRDLFYFCQIKNIKKVVGIEPCLEFVDLAKKRCSESNLVKVIHSDICDDELNIGKYNFEGVFCLASLFHIPLKKLDIAFKKIADSVVQNGFLLSTFPETNTTREQEMNDKRWSTSLSYEDHIKYLNEVGFKEVERFKLKIYNGNWDTIISIRL